MGEANKAGKFDWETGLFVIIYHALLLIGLPIYLWFQRPSWKIWLAAFVIYYLCGLAITAGYHRLYAHRSYKAHPIVHILMLYFGALAVAGTCLRWCYKHRLHHKHVDTEKDPYNIKKGFWYAHIFWMMRKSEASKVDMKIVSDLTKNKYIMFQHNHHFLCMFLSSASSILLVGWLTGDYLGAFFITFLFRMFVVHHVMFSVNSVAHTWGHQPFSKEHTAVDNPLFALITFGEAYHNFHHSFASDYRNGIRWYNYDPGKWAIWIGSKVGLATDLKEADWTTIKRKWVEENREMTLEAIKKNVYVKQKELAKKVTDYSDSISKSLAEFKAKKVEYAKKYDTLKRNRSEKRRFRREIRKMQKSINNDCKSWSKLCHSIMRMDIE